MVGAGSGGSGVIVVGPAGVVVVVDGEVARFTVTTMVVVVVV
jgi:hypothetical protein